MLSLTDFSGFLRLEQSCFVCFALDGIADRALQQKSVDVILNQVIGGASSGGGYINLTGDVKTQDDLTR